MPLTNPILLNNFKRVIDPNENYLLNEGATKDAINAYNVAIELDSPDMESFLEMLSDYFERNAGSITNMNAKKIAEHLFSAYVLIKKRTGN